MSFVRSSKFRHVYGRPTRKEHQIDNLKVSKNAWDSNIIKANPKYLSVNWEASGGGAFAVIPIDWKGKVPDLIPLFRGHTATVLDTDWNPFNDSLIASASDDGKVFIWQVPDDFTLHTENNEDPKDVAPVQRLMGHARKVGHVLFHPSAENVLASSSGDFTIKVWDIEAGSPRYTLKHNDIVQSMSWSALGNLMVTTCRDKKLRIWDVRQEKAAHEVQGHHGAKNSRAVWMGELDRIATTGFSRMSDRQLGLWDVRNPAEPMNGFETLDSISGVCMPFWDDGTKCLYLAGKGDGNIRYYEYTNDEFIYLSEYKSTDPQRGVAFIPRRGLSVHENEVMKAYKTVNDTHIEPISFIVPRRAETFQSDIFPDAPSGKPGLSGEEWFAGKDALPPTFALETLYSEDGGVHAQTVTSTFSPTTTHAPVASTFHAPAPSPAAAASTTSSSISGHIPRKLSVSEAKKAFQSPPSPVKNTFRQELPTVAEPVRPASPVKSKPEPIGTSGPSASLYEHRSSSPELSRSPMPMKSKFKDVSEQLDHITQLLEAQTMTIVSQNVMISQLSKDLEAIKSKLGSEEEKDRYIRRLEGELDNAKRNSPIRESMIASARQSMISARESIISIKADSEKASDDKANDDKASEVDASERDIKEDVKEDTKEDTSKEDTAKEDAKEE